jgi:hypothetical protein
MSEASNRRALENEGYTASQIDRIMDVKSRFRNPIEELRRILRRTTDEVERARITAQIGNMVEKLRSEYARAHANGQGGGRRRSRRRMSRRRRASSRKH